MAFSLFNNAGLFHNFVTERNILKEKGGAIVEFIIGLLIVIVILFLIVTMLSIEKQLRQLNKTMNKVVDLLKEEKL